MPSSGLLSRKALVQAYVCALLVVTLPLCLVCGQTRTVCPISLAQDEFPGQHSEAMVLAGFDQLRQVRNITGQNVAENFELCMNLTLRGTNTTLPDYAEVIVAESQQTVGELLQRIPVIPATHPHCLLYVRQLMSIYGNWTKATLLTYSHRIIRAEVLLTYLDTALHESKLDDCAAERESQIVRDPQITELGQILAQLQVVLQWLETTWHFYSVIDESEHLAHGMQSIWDMLPTKEAGWHFVNDPSETNHYHLFGVLSSAQCSTLARFEARFCVHQAPSLTEGCAVQPNSTTMKTLQSVLRYTNLLTAAVRPHELALRQWFQLVSLDPGTANAGLCTTQPPVGAATQSAAAGDYRNGTRCLNLDCDYPYTMVRDTRLRDKILTHDLRERVQLAFTASPSIDDIHSCGRSCLRVFSLETSTMVMVCVIVNYVLTAVGLTVYSYAILVVCYNWRKIFETLHWRALIYVNACLLGEFVIERLNLFAQAARSMCIDNNAIAFAIPYQTASWHCRVSATSQDIVNIIFPLFTAWQAFIWFSYIRRVTSMRVALTSTTKKRWARILLIGEVLVLLAVLLIIVMPFALRKYDHLEVDAQPLGMPCALFGASPFYWSQFIGLGLHVSGLLLLGTSHYFFIKSSVVTTKIWKIPIIGSSWMRTQSSLRHDKAKTVDPDVVMRQTQNRIAFFMVFVILYQSGVFVVSFIQGNLIDPATAAKFSLEFHTKTHCHVFSCYPKECATSYTFTEDIQQTFLPRLVYKMVFNALGLCLLSFLAFPGFVQPWTLFCVKYGPEDYGKKQTKPSKDHWEAKLAKANSMESIVSRKSASDRKLTPRAVLTVAQTSLSMLPEDQSGILETPSSPRSETKRDLISYSTQCTVPTSGSSPAILGGNHGHQVVIEGPSDDGREPSADPPTSTSSGLIASKLTASVLRASLSIEAATKSTSLPWVALNRHCSSEDEDLAFNYSESNIYSNPLKKADRNDAGACNSASQNKNEVRESGSMESFHSQAPISQ
eukprot:scpid33818/ scgid2248/ 